MITGPYKVRSAAAADISTMTAIERLSNPHPWSADDFAAALQKNHGLVLTVAAEIGAFLLFSANSEFSEILLLATHPDYRKNHFAAALTANLVQYNRNHAIPRILLEVRKANLKAIEFYKKQGFSQISCRRNYYTNPVDDALIWEKLC